MTSLLRCTTPEDAPQIKAFCEGLLEVAQGSPVFSAAHMQWKYWEPWSTWQGSRGYVLTRDTVIVAHGAVLPISYRFADRTLRFAQVYDWASAPSAVGAGASLLKRIGAMVDGLLVIGGSEKTQRMVRPLGFRPFGSVTRYALPRSQVTARFSAPEHPTQQTRRYSQTDLRAGTELTRPVSTPISLHAERSTGALADFARCAIAPSTYHEVRNAGELTGSFVLTLTPGQARISDAWAIEPAHWDRVHEAACRAALTFVDALEVACQTNDLEQERSLRGLGFQSCGSDALFLLASKEHMANDAHVRFQLLDSDLAFLHQGSTERWCEAP